MPPSFATQTASGFASSVSEPARARVSAGKSPEDYEENEFNAALGVQTHEEQTLTARQSPAASGADSDFSSAPVGASADVTVQSDSARTEAGLSAAPEERQEHQTSGGGASPIRASPLAAPLAASAAVSERKRERTAILPPLASDAAIAETSEEDGERKMRRRWQANHLHPTTLTVEDAEPPTEPGAASRKGKRLGSELEKSDSRRPKTLPAEDTTASSPAPLASAASPAADAAVKSAAVKSSAAKALAAKPPAKSAAKPPAKPDAPSRPRERSGSELAQDDGKRSKTKTAQDTADQLLKSAATSSDAALVKSAAAAAKPAAAAAKSAAAAPRSAADAKSAANAAAKPAAAARPDAAAKPAAKPAAAARSAASKLAKSAAAVARPAAASEPAAVLKPATVPKTPQAKPPAALEPAATSKPAAVAKPAQAKPSDDEPAAASNRDATEPVGARPAAPALPAAVRKPESTKPAGARPAAPAKDAVAASAAAKAAVLQPAAPSQSRLDHSETSLSDLGKAPAVSAEAAAAPREFAGADDAVPPHVAALPVLECVRESAESSRFKLSWGRGSAGGGVLKLGRGSFGAVTLCRDHRSGAMLARKDGSRSRVSREAGAVLGQRVVERVRPRSLESRFLESPV